MEALPDRNERVFSTSLLNDFVVFSLIEERKAGGIYLRIFESPSNGLHEIDLNARSDDDCLGEINSGNDKRILTDQFIFWIRGDDVISCNAGNKIASLKSAIEKLFVQSGIENESARFSLLSVPSRSATASIKKHGVAGIDLKISAYANQPSLADVKTSHPFF